EPSLPDTVSDIRVMGGAAMTLGNTTPMAEANFHNDPVAAKRVVASASPKLASLDALDYATVLSDLIDEYRESEPPLDTVGAWMDYPEEVRQYGATDDPIIHDAAVVADVLDGVLSYETYYLDVDTSQGPSRGAVVCDKYGVYDEEPNAEVSVEIDVEGFRRTLRRTLESL
ncbi:MAG: nucleoside hydrolase, partial [Halobacteria archaeon]|nr:nucleoside hydrolase [Halobacteria archaeon]